MIAYLKGKVLDFNSKQAIIDVGGIGYKIFINQKIELALKVGEEKEFFSYLVVREGVLDLYGFLTKEERDFFELLLNVSGLGPKGASNILAKIKVNSLARAIIGEDTSIFQGVSRVGKKTAQKIILELKNKVNSLEIKNNFIGKEDKKRLESDWEEGDAFEALCSLGYPGEKVKETLRQIIAHANKTKKTLKTEEKIKEALRYLAKF